MLPVAEVEAVQCIQVISQLELTYQAPVLCKVKSAYALADFEQQVAFLAMYA